MKTFQQTHFIQNNWCKQSNVPAKNVNKLLDFAFTVSSWVFAHNLHWMQMMLMTGALAALNGLALPSLQDNIAKPSNLLTFPDPPDFPLHSTFTNILSWKTNENHLNQAHLQIKPWTAWLEWHRRRSKWKLCMANLLVFLTTHPFDTITTFSLNRKCYKYQSEYRFQYVAAWNTEKVLASHQKATKNNRKMWRSRSDSVQSARGLVCCFWLSDSMEMKCLLRKCVHHLMRKNEMNTLNIFGWFDVNSEPKVRQPHTLLFIERQMCGSFSVGCR